MDYQFVAIPETELIPAADPSLQHIGQTYVSETNKTASIWKAVTDDLLDFSPHKETNSIRTIFEHQLLSERRFFFEFVGLTEPPVAELLPPGKSPNVEDYIERYVDLAKRRLPQLAEHPWSWWLTEQEFFGFQRQRIWTFWRRVLHTCHHRTQIQSWLRLAGAHVPAIYGPSGDVTWDGATPTYRQ